MLLFSGIQLIVETELLDSNWNCELGILLRTILLR